MNLEPESWLMIVAAVVTPVTAVVWRRFERSAAEDGVEDWKDTAVELGEDLAEEIRDDVDKPDSPAR